MPSKKAHLRNTGFSVVLVIVVLASLFLVSPFIYKAVTGGYPPGFPKEGFKEFLPPPEAFRQPPRQESGKIEAPVKGPEGRPKIFKSLTFMDLDSDPMDIKKAKDLGANSVTIALNVGVYDQTFSFPQEIRGQILTLDLKRNIGPLVNEAHRQGLYVELRILQSPQADPAKDFNQEVLVKSFAKLVSELAEFSEEYGVYQLTVAGEIDTTIHRAYKNPPQRSLKVEELAPFIRAALSAAKSNFKGRVGIGVASPRPYITGGSSGEIDVQGYDYLVYSYYPRPPDKDLSVFKSELLENIKAARKIASENGFQEIIWGETGVLDDKERMPGFFGGNSGWLQGTEDFEAQFYQLAFEESQGLVDGYSIFYSFPVFSIKGDKAEEIIKEYFAKF